jgi:hypothetical protein
MLSHKALSSTSPIYSKGLADFCLPQGENGSTQRVTPSASVIHDPFVDENILLDPGIQQHNIKGGNFVYEVIHAGCLIVARPLHALSTAC